MLKISNRIAWSPVLDGMFTRDEEGRLVKACGCPRSATIVSSTRVTLRLAKLVSTYNAKML